MSTAYKRILIFLATVFILTCAVAFFLMSNGGMQNEDASVFFSVMMLLPAFSVIIAQFFTKEGFRNPLFKLNFRENVSRYLLCYFLMQLLTIAGTVIYFLIFPSRFDGKLSVIADMILQQTGQQPQQGDLYRLMAVQIGFSFFSGPLLNIFFAFGEEYGWRGYLLPKLCEVMCPLNAALITGLMWGISYAPMVALGYNYGSEYSGFPFTGIIAMIVFCIFAGVIYAYFTLKTKNVFPAVLMHSAMNVFSSAGLLFDIQTSNVNPFVGPTLFSAPGCIGVLIFGVICAVLLRKEKNYEQ